MIGRFVFHRWERRLAEVSRHERLVRPFDWGLDWIEAAGHPPATQPLDVLQRWVDTVMQDSDAFFTPPPTDDYEFTPARDEIRAGGEAGTLRFPSALTTPHPENNIVHARYFPANPLRPFARAGVRSAKADTRTAKADTRSAKADTRSAKADTRSAKALAERPRLLDRRAVVVLAQWNSDAEGHVGLCKLLAKLGISSLRISLPYHDVRMPPELTRADYIVSSNIGRTLQICRQAVLDVRRALWWLRDQGYDRLGLLGTSLGSCLAMLAGCHEPLVRAMALNHVSPFFADVVWRGLSTEHVHATLSQHVTLEQLRELWKPIAPWSYLERAREKKSLLVYARYDLTFPLDLSKILIDEMRRRGLPVDVRMLPCGHYTTGEAPFKYLDGYYLGRFLASNL